MFKDHPLGLRVLFFTEMWERFGFYTMLAIFVYYLQENFGWDQATVTNIYGIFLAGVYFTPIVGGWLADNVLGYGKTITLGAITMGIGYALMATPTQEPILLFAALGVVAIGNGLFKANISVLVGNLYGHSQKSLKDAGFNIFYMGINIGAFYAPFAAAGIKNFFMENFGTTLAQGYNAAFGVASAGMVISLIIFQIFKKYYKDADYQSKNETNNEKDIVLTKSQERERVIALLTIFGIVIFFWMAFHQNGAALSLFARDYTHPIVGKFTFLLFDVIGLHALLAIILGGSVLLKKTSTSKSKLISGSFVLAGILILIYKINFLPAEGTISPEQFQAFNPMFIVLMTPVIVGMFAWMNKKGKEPSSPAKIGIGMLITALAYVIMIVASLGLAPVHSLNGAGSAITVSPFFLISTYFTLTIAELHLSPMGLSFVSKVAPPRMKGLLMGGWFGATAIGNYLAGFVGRYYQEWELWQFFLILIVCASLAAFMVLLTLKKLKKATE
ncbi:MAG: MFS transporter [Ignavibacteriae bacterium HGW-Ignavibacteriae-2]|jgi:POT family proton-dependent oligopeptide transporter|nr:MAG: MFS transporter [Ignavibacteriae bacterium HGW-Ignavibacteriae-2]